MMVEEISKQALATKLMLDMKTSVLQVKQGEEISSVVQIPNQVITASGIFNAVTIFLKLEAKHESLFLYPQRGSPSLVSRVNRAESYAYAMAAADWGN